MADGIFSTLNNNDPGASGFNIKQGIRNISGTLANSFSIGMIANSPPVVVSGTDL